MILGGLFEKFTETINVVLISINYFIYCAKYKGNQLSFIAFKKYLQFQFNIDRFIFIKNMNPEKLNVKWSFLCEILESEELNMQ